MFEEKTEFKFDSNALGADANLAFMRMVSLDGVARAFSTVCWTSVYKCLRVFTSVYERLRAFTSVYERLRVVWVQFMQFV